MLERAAVHMEKSRSSAVEIRYVRTRYGTGLWVSGKKQPGHADAWSGKVPDDTEPRDRHYGHVVIARPPATTCSTRARRRRKRQPERCFGSIVPRKLGRAGPPSVHSRCNRSEQAPYDLEGQQTVD